MVIKNSLDSLLLDILGSWPVWKTLPEINGSILYRLARHLADDGFGE
jgi:hypothetical protein